MTCRAGRRAVAGAQAGRCDHAGLRQRRAQGVAQCRRTGHRTRQAVADAHRHRGWRRRVIRDHVEMRVEGRGLERRDGRQVEQVGEGAQMRMADAAEAVLHRVQRLDQQIGPARQVADRLAHLHQCRRVERCAAGARARTPRPVRCHTSFLPRGSWSR
jgi:hypothetical protein